MADSPIDCAVEMFKCMVLSDTCRALAEMAGWCVIGAFWQGAQAYEDIEKTPCFSYFHLFVLLATVPAAGLAVGYKASALIYEAWDPHSMSTRIGATVVSYVGIPLVAALVCSNVAGLAVLGTKKLLTCCGFF